MQCLLVAVLPRLTMIPLKTLRKLYALYAKWGNFLCPAPKSKPLELRPLSPLPYQVRSERMPLNGKVVWVHHRSQGNRPAGYALQLSKDEAGLRIKNEN